MYIWPSCVSPASEIPGIPSVYLHAPSVKVRFICFFFICFFLYKFQKAGMPYHVDHKFKYKANKSVLIMSSESLLWIIVLSFNWCQTCFVQKFE